jgi:hypothetical protein
MASSRKLEVPFFYLFNSFSRSRFLWGNRFFFRKTRLVGVKKTEDSEVKHLKSRVTHALSILCPSPHTYLTICCWQAMHTLEQQRSLGVGFPRHVVSGAVVRLWLEGKYSA